MVFTKCLLPQRGCLLIEIEDFNKRGLGILIKGGHPRFALVYTSNGDFTKKTNEGTKQVLDLQGPQTCELCHLQI